MYRTEIFYLGNEKVSLDCVVGFISLTFQAYIKKKSFNSKYSSCLALVFCPRLLGMQAGADENQTTNLPFSGSPVLPPKLQPPPYIKI